MPAITVPDVGEQFITDFETYVSLRRDTRLADIEHQAQLTHIGGFASELASRGYETPDAIPADEARQLASGCIRAARLGNQVLRAKQDEFESRHILSKSFVSLCDNRVEIETLDRRSTWIVDSISGIFATKVEGKLAGIWPEEGRITLFGLTRYRRRISSSSPYYHIEAIDMASAKSRVLLKVKD